MKYGSFAVSIVLAFVLATEGTAQPRPTLPDRLDTLTVRYAGSVIGRGIMHWTRRNGELVQTYAWTSAYDGGRVIDSLFSDAATLVPRREVRVAGDTVRELTFSTRGISSRTFERGTVVDETSVAGSGLFSSASIELLAASMPLSVGAAADFKTYHAPPSRLALQATRITVAARETVDGRVAWRVTASTPGGGSTFWIDEATRTVLRMDTREGDAVITFRREAGGSDQQTAARKATSAAQQASRSLHRGGGMRAKRASNRTTNRSDFALPQR